MRNCLLCVLLAGCLVNSGCGCVNWFGYVVAPSMPTKTIKAEYDGLARKTVAIAVYAGPETLLDYQTVQVEISDAVGAELRRNVRGVDVVNPMRVIRYQDEDPRWYSLPPGSLCPRFNADYVLLISVMDFSTRAPGAVHLARGRISAEASLYQAERPGLASPETPVWRSEVIQVVYPRESTLGVPANDDADVRRKTAGIFAQVLVKSFYDHKAPKEP